MNLRISNLSSVRNLQVKATKSARLFDGQDIYTSTDSTVALVPDEDSVIEGTLHLAPGNIKITLTTDLSKQMVIVKTAEGEETQIPLDKNIAIESSHYALGVSSF